MLRRRVPALLATTEAASPARVFPLHHGARGVGDARSPAKKGILSSAVPPGGVALCGGYHVPGVCGSPGNILAPRNPPPAWSARLGPLRGASFPCHRASQGRYRPRRHPPRPPLIHGLVSLADLEPWGLVARPTPRPTSLPLRHGCRVGSHRQAPGAKRTRRDTSSGRTG